MRYATILAALGLGLLIPDPTLAERPRQLPTRKDQGGQAGRAVPLQQPSAKEATAEVVVLHATNNGKGIDSRIGKVPQLKQPPFSSYNSYQLLRRSKIPLQVGKTAALALPNRGKFELALTDVGKDKRRYNLRVSIIKPDGKTFLPNRNVNARAGNIFLIAGQKFKKGILVLGTRARPKK